jgi:hypothetical protein
MATSSAKSASGFSENASGIGPYLEQYPTSNFGKLIRSMRRRCQYIAFFIKQLDE